MCDEEWEGIYLPSAANWIRETLSRPGRPVPDTLVDEVALRLRYTYHSDEMQSQCADNLRVALPGEAGQVSAYRQAYASGCCGFVDELWFVGEHSVPVMVGWNFGH